MSKITNKFNLPEPIVLTLTEDDYSRGKSNRSVTQLIDSARTRILMKEYDDVVEYDVSEMLWMVLGKTVHTMFEKHAKGKYLAEKRLFAEIAGWTISGAIDVRKAEGAETVTLIDYKSTSVWKIIYGHDEWTNQLNFYGWLAEQSDLTLDKLQVVAILRDWKQREALQDSKYPQAPIMIVDIPLWTPEQRQKYVEERVKVHQDAEFTRLTGGILPHCTDKERWMKATTYAVMKNKNKKASRVLHDGAEAERWIEDWHKKNPGKKDKLRVEVRKGEATRCAQGWCRVAQYCDQYQGELANE